MSNQTTVTIKELSAMLGVSEDTVRRNREKWKLDTCICHVKCKPELFFRASVSVVLLRARVIDRPI